MDRGGATPNFTGDLSRHCTEPVRCHGNKKKSRPSRRIISLYCRILRWNSDGASCVFTRRQHRYGVPRLSVALRAWKRARGTWIVNDERWTKRARAEIGARGTPRPRPRPRRPGKEKEERKKGRKGEREKEEAYKIDLKGCGLARLFIIKNDKSNRFSPMRCGLPRVAKRDAAAAGRRRNEKEKKWECMVGNNECNAPSSSAPLTTKTAPRAGVVAIAVVTADCFGLTIILSRRV